MKTKQVIAILVTGVLAMTAVGCQASEKTEKPSSPIKKTSSLIETDSKPSDDPGSRSDKSKKETLFQVALLQSLTQGYYDGMITVDSLKKHGDTGIGTFEGVNGEMIVLDGTVYQALGDGSVKVADDKETVPFSNVTFFEEDGKLTLTDIDSVNALKEKLTDMVNQKGKNLFYMVKVQGEFPQMLVRSELKQEKPYKSLDKALETDQREFTYENISGTVVALYCPDYMSGLNAAGWHFHFLSDDKTKGGHVLDLSFNTAEAVYDLTPTFAMYLPDDNDFQKMELAKNVDDAIKKVETNE